MTPAQRGTALHLAMQYLSLEGDSSPAAVGEELDRLTQAGFLTRLQRQAVEPERLSAFLTSPLGREMAAAKEKCRREFKFSVLDSALNYFPFRGQIGCRFVGIDPSQPFHQILIRLLL